MITLIFWVLGAFFYILIFGLSIYVLIRLVAIIVAFFVIKAILIHTVSWICKQRIVWKYGLELPSNTLVGLNLFRENCVIWKRPHWIHERVDGGPDRRYKSNAYIEPYSYLYVDNFKVRSKDLQTLEQCMKAFRDVGVSINGNSWWRSF